MIPDSTKLLRTVIAVFLDLREVSRIETILGSKVWLLRILSTCFWVPAAKYWNTLKA